MKSQHSTPVIIAVIAFFVTIILQIGFRAFSEGVNDFYFPVCGARALLAGGDPYATCHVIFDREYPQNPMTTILATVPVAWLGEYAAGLVLYGLSVGLLVYGIARYGKPWQLLIFTGFPFWHSFQALQWSVLMAAIYLIPSLLPLAIVKPQQSIPLLLTRMTKKRLIVILLFFLLSVAVYPSWLVKWLSQALGSYDGFVPALAFPGVLLLLSLANWINPEARFLGFMSMVPQRAYYDQTMLWLLVKTPGQMIILSLCSWSIPLINYLIPIPVPGLWIVLLEYFPVMLMVVDWQRVAALFSLRHITHKIGPNLNNAGAVVSSSPIQPMNSNNTPASANDGRSAV